MSKFLQLNKRKTDSVRGFALVLMVLCHSTIQILDVNGITEHWLLQINDLTSHIRMPLFMVLTGYIVAIQASRQCFCFQTRIWRLAIPFVVATIAILSIKFLATGRGDVLPIIGFHLLVPYAHLWYLPSLLLILGFFAAAKRITGNGEMAATATVLVALLLGALGLADEKLLSIGHALQLAPYFAAGYFARSLTVEPDMKSWTALSIVAIALVASLAPAATGRMAAIVGFVFILALLVPASTILAFLGQRSMPIFLYHSLAISAVSRLLDIGLWAEFAAAGTLAFAFPLILHWLTVRALPQASILLGNPPSRHAASSVMPLSDNKMPLGLSARNPGISQARIS